jgi:hypothetical protein
MADIFDEAFRRVSSDAGLRAVLKTAREWGVSPRRFLGWEPTRTLGHSYESGVLVRTTEALEVEWDDENRSLAMAYAMWLADLCPGCQRPMTETMRAENEGLYVAEAAMRCHSCTAHHQASNAYSDAPTPEALFIPVTLREMVTSDAGRTARDGT